MTKYHLYLVIFILAASCGKDELKNIQKDEEGVIISSPYEWKTSLHLSNPVSNSGISAQVYYKGNFLSPVTNGGNNRMLAMINSDSGDIIWTWDDRYQPETERISIKYYHKYNDLLTYQVGSRSYCINLDDGTTYWKLKRESSFSGKLSGLENIYFSLGESITKFDEFDEQVVFKGDIETGEIEEYIIPDFTLEHTIGNRIGDVTRVEPWEHNGIQYLAITWQELTDDEIWNFQTYLGLYNTETDAWVYEKKIMNEPNLYGVVLAPPVIYNNKIYANVDHHLVCHDLKTGEQIWSKAFKQDFMFSGFIIVEDKIIGSNEDETLYCLNPENGRIIWTGEGSGTSSRLAYLNGIVYFSGGGDGYLHGVDISSGQTVWRLKADNIDGSMFAAYNPVYVLPAKDGKPARVFAHTLGHVVCFEAYK